MIYLVIFAVVVAVVIFGLASAQGDYKKNRARSEEAKRQLFELPDLSIEDAYVNIDGSGLGIDVTNRLIVIVQNEKIRRFKFEDITYVSICEDSSTIMKTDRADQLLGLAVGGVVAGGIGAVVGGLSGARNSDDIIKRLFLRVGVNDIASPVFDITFLHHPTGFKKNLNSFTKKLYQESSDNMVKWYSRFQTILKSS